MIVQGQVQGVGFRYYTRRRADKLGLAGYVRNLADGSVEVEIEGDEPAVARMLDWLNTGPRSASVDHTRVVDVPATGETGFCVIH